LITVALVHTSLTGTHSPAAQDVPPPQARPQAPQLALSVCAFTSQPSPACPLQSRNPLTHDATLHAPPLQAPEALGGRQAIPQPPQWASEPLVSVSHPVTALPSQSPQPALQSSEHAPLVQRGEPFCDGHTLLHAPQLLTSPAMLVSQPLEVTRSQSWYPALQAAMTQLPALHAGIALGSEHALPQPPQLAVLESSATSQPSEGLRLQSP